MTNELNIGLIGLGYTGKVHAAARASMRTFVTERLSAPGSSQREIVEAAYHSSLHGTATIKLPLGLI